MCRILALIAALMMLNTVSAQNAKFGKPSKEDWEVQSVPFAPDAEAVVLYKSVEVKYSLSGAFSAYGSSGDGSLNDDGLANLGTNKFYSAEGASLEYNVKVRTKILKDSGAEYASLDIVTLNDKNDMNMHDEFYEMSVVLFKNVNGKVTKKKIPGNSFIDERIDDHYFIRHIRVPNVQAGDIIEYQYTVFSNRSTFIYDTQMQECIPVMYSKCVMDIPHFLQFNVNKPEGPNFTANAELGQILIRDPNNNLQNPRKCVTNVYTIEGRYIPPYDGVIDLKNLTEGKVLCVRTLLADKRYDVQSEPYGEVRHLIIGK